MSVKKKCYVIMLSKTFPAHHCRYKQLTYFEKSILNGTKIHTIRDNYELWVKRFVKIDKGEAYISLRQWSGIAYRSKQIEIAQVHKPSLQRVIVVVVNNPVIPFKPGMLNFSEGIYALANNDGLDSIDFCSWIFPSMISGLNVYQGAIIHFTDHRYSW